MKTEPQNTDTFRLRTWYGLNARVENGPQFWHRAGLGQFMIPHPPLINWLLRLGLPAKEKDRLGVTHEFGHLQTLPVYLLYTAILIGIFIGRDSMHFGGWILLFISTHAFWEILSELYVIYRLGPLYTLFYEDIPVLPRLVFWTAMSATMLSGWLLF